MAEITALQYLSNAKEKLKQNKFPLECLPKEVSDPAWNDIKQECGMLLPEFTALKNEVAGTTPKSVYSISLFADSDSNLFDVRRLQQRLVLLSRKNFTSFYLV